MGDEMMLTLELTHEDLEAEKTDGTPISAGTLAPVSVPPDPVNEQRFVGTIAVIVTVSVAWIAKRMTDHWIKDKERGVQIDLRTTPPTVSRISGVPNGFVVIIDAAGKARTIRAAYEKREDMERLLTLALTGQAG